MSYKIHSIFRTIQGEGFHAGKRAIFVRFTACNVWDGDPAHRERDAEAHSLCARICDTEFRGSDTKLHGGLYTDPAEVVDIARCLWNGVEGGERLVVFTGGEPCLQLNDDLVRAFYKAGFYTAVETNGTRPIPRNLNWVSMSPKLPMPIHNVERQIDELKLLSIYLPELKTLQARLLPKSTFKWIQPVDMGPGNEQQSRDEMRRALEFVDKNPDWRMGFQHHKAWGVL